MNDRHEERDAEARQRDRRPRGAGGLLAALLMGSFGLFNRRPSFSNVLGIVTDSVMVNLDAAGINDLPIEGVALMQLAAAILDKAGVDKTKVLKLFEALLAGKTINEDADTTKLAAEIIGGHVEACFCADHHPVLVPDDDAGVAQKHESRAAASEPSGESAPREEPKPPVEQPAEP